MVDPITNFQQLQDYSPLAASQQLAIANRISKSYQRGWIKTIDDLMAATYGKGFGGSSLRKDSATATSTSGARNIIYGASLMAQVVVKANSFGCLRKEPWKKSGYRAITAAASTGSMGISQGGGIPATIQETFAEIGITPKVLATSFDMTTTQIKLEGKDDVVTWEERQKYQRREAQNRLNRALNTNVTTLASTNMESIDRMLSSYAEVTNCGDIHAGDSDPYGAADTGAWNDRDNATGWTDAYVDHNSNTDEYFKLDDIDTVLQNIMPYWDDESSRQGKCMITGYDTVFRIAQLLRSQNRYNQARAKTGMNGISTMPGVESGFEVATYDSIPIVPDNNVVQDTLSRINIIDDDNVFIGVLQPFTYLESEDYQAIDKFAREGVYYMEAELVCTKFASSGKIRDKK